MKKSIALVAATTLAFGLAGCDVDQTEEGELPEVEVEGGNMPEYDVEAPDVEVGTEEVTVDVPTVDVDTEDAEGEPPIGRSRVDLRAGTCQHLQPDPARPEILRRRHQMAQIAAEAGV